MLSISNDMRTLRSGTADYIMPIGPIINPSAIFF
jgi:hypothetical protein